MNQSRKPHLVWVGRLPLTWQKALLETGWEIATTEGFFGGLRLIAEVWPWFIVIAERLEVARFSERLQQHEWWKRIPLLVIDNKGPHEKNVINVQSIQELTSKMLEIQNQRKGFSPFSLIPKNKTYSFKISLNLLGILGSSWLWHGDWEPGLAPQENWFFSSGGAVEGWWAWPSSRSSRDRSFIVTSPNPKIVHLKKPMVMDGVHLPSWFGKFEDPHKEAFWKKLFQEAFSVPWKDPWNFAYEEIGAGQVRIHIQGEPSVSPKNFGSLSFRQLRWIVTHSLARGIQEHQIPRQGTSHEFQLKGEIVQWDERGGWCKVSPGPRSMIWEGLPHGEALLLPSQKELRRFIWMGDLSMEKRIHELLMHSHGTPRSESETTKKY